MTTIKSYTDLEQSRKLAEVLPLESADMYWFRDNVEVPRVYLKDMMKDSVSVTCPCWSFAALFDIIPIMIGSVFEKDALRLRIDKSETDFNIWYDNLDTGMVEEGFDIIKTNPVDACVAMIEKLNELNLL